MPATVGTPTRTNRLLAAVTKRDRGPILKACEEVTLVFAETVTLVVADGATRFVTTSAVVILVTIVVVTLVTVVVMVVITLVTATWATSVLVAAPGAGAAVISGLAKTSWFAP